MKSQTQEIYDYLKQGHSISQPMAYRPPFHCTRLAARICDLRASGVDVVTTTFKYKSPRTGRPVQYAVYKLGDL